MVLAHGDPVAALAAVGLAHAQAVRTDRGAVRAAGDDGDVVPRARQLARVVAAGADDQHAGGCDQNWTLGTACADSGTSKYSAGLNPMQPAKTTVAICLIAAL